MLRKARRAILILSAAGVLLAGAAWASLGMPYRGFQGDLYVQFQRGSSSRAMAASLAQTGVIRYAWQFWLARVLHPGARLQAGEYQFREPASVLQVFSRMVRGDVFFFDVTIPEGSNIFQIAETLEGGGIMPQSDFLMAASDPATVQDLDPAAKSLEGYLFPSTYRIAHSTTASELCRLMTDQFRRQWKKLAAEGASVHDTVTLASMVEKETGVAEERALVAGVFANRLKQGMRLGCDPTVIYAALLVNGYKGVIHRSDLDRNSPYNTYLHEGLPPGPIANPGAGALEASLHPAATDFLYFVAKPSGGGHQFSSTLAEHDKAVQSYRHGNSKSRSNPAKAARKAG